MTFINGKHIVFAMISLIACLLIDIFIDLELSVGYIYCLIILATKHKQTIQKLHLISGLSVLFVIIPDIINPPPVHSSLFEADVINRTIAIITIIATWYYSTRQLKAKQTLEDQKLALDNVINAVQLGTISIQDSYLQLNEKAKALTGLDENRVSISEFCTQFDSTNFQSVEKLIFDEASPTITIKTKKNDFKYEWLQLILVSQTSGIKTFAVQPITQQEQVDILIEKERLKFEQLANSLPIFITTFNQNGEMDFISENHEHFFGAKLSELRTGWQAYIHKEDATVINEQWVNALHNKKPTTLKYRVINRNAQTCFFVSHLKPIKNANTGKLSWFCASFDNTTTEALRLENDKLVAKLQGILQGMEDGFISLQKQDDSYIIEYHNFRAEILVNLDPFAEGAPIESASSFFDNPTLIQKLSEVESDQNTRTLSVQYNQSDLFIRVHASLNGIRLYIQDITAEKASIDELNLLRKAIDKANDVVLITKSNPLDLPGPEVVYVNDAFETVTGYKKSDILGQSPRLLKGPNTEREQLDEIKEALKKGKPVRVLLTNYTKLGDEYFNEVDISPVKDELGKVTHFIAVERDISKQKVQEELAFRAHKMDSIGLVTGGVAHDFNNLLTIIMGNAEILLDENTSSTPKENRDKLLAITEAATQGVSLTRSLLAFSKRQPFADNIVDLEKVVKSIQPIISTALGAEIKFEVSNKSTIKFVNGDQSQVESLFLNMAINARDAMNKGGKFIVNICDTEIKAGDPLTATLKPGQFVKITFSDNGTGIEKEYIDKIFDPFFSTKPLTKGTGLGLSMIYSFISQSGGHIEVQSRLGYGTDFIVYLQVSQKEQKSALNNTLQSDTNIEKQPSFSDKTVLIVEDTEMVAKVAIHILSSIGFTVYKAEDAASALELFDQHQIDLLFTDIILPNGMNGKELAEKIRDKNPKLPIIYTSGFTDGKLKHEDYQQDNVEFLQKPYTKKGLLEVINKTVI